MVATPFGILDEELRNRAVVTKTRDTDLDALKRNVQALARRWARKPSARKPRS
jgi:hypothetical protein